MTPELTNPCKGLIFELLYRGQQMAYTKEWWSKNGGAITKTRKSRYANDPVYREALKARSKEYRDKRRAQREAFLQAPYIEINGIQVAAKTMAMTCEVLGIPISRLKYLQKTGYIPHALVIRPVRLYTQNQIFLIGELELFLKKCSKYLRSTRTQEGIKAQADLDTHIDITKANWKK